MKKILKATIYALAFGGDGVGKIEGKICFVSGALPGEEVAFKVSKETPSYIKGSVTEILKPSPDRVEPECKYYKYCGGCQLQHLAYEKEVSYKREQVIELLNRIAGISQVGDIKITPSDKCYNYRSTVTLHRVKKRYGFYSKDSSTITEIDSCQLAIKAINDKIAALRNSKEKDSKDKDVTLKVDHMGQVWSSDRQGQRFYVDSYKGNEMFFSPKSFSQGNRFVSEKIAEVLGEWMPSGGENTAFFDVYCGVGFFSFMLGERFGNKIGIDSTRTAIDCAKTTVKTRKLEGYKFYKAEAEESFFDIFGTNKKEKNIILLDPPRKGLNKDFLNKLKIEPGIDLIYYISCDPARLARDIKVFTEDNVWNLGRIQIFDMFPRTKHIETLVELTR